MEESSPTPLRHGALRKMVFSILLVLTVASAAYLISKEPIPLGRENLIDLSVRDVDVRPDSRSHSAADVERYFSDVFGVNIKIPVVQGAEITGIGTVNPQPGISIPTILLNDPQGDVDRFFAFTYSMLDEWAFGVFLDRSVRLELEHSGSYAVVSASDGHEVVLWRSGDDIFVAVARQGASRLISRID